jgi:hypothetical protein
MRLTVQRARRVGAGAAVVLLGAVVVSPALGGSGIGAIFNLGKTNSVNAVTTLTGKSSSRMMQITNSGSGSALYLSTKSNVAPMKVTSSVKVANLNADKLDGIDSTGFVQRSGEIQVALGSTAWVAQSPVSPPVATLVVSGIGWKRSITGATYLVASPMLPVAEFGKATELRGFEFCFAPGVGNELNAVQLAIASSTASGTTVVSPIDDTTTRTARDCHVFTLPTPAVLDATTSVSLFAGVNWTTANTTFGILRTTFVLGATSTPATVLVP